MKNRRGGNLSGGHSNNLPSPRACHQAKGACCWTSPTEGIQPSIIKEWRAR